MLNEKFWDKYFKVYDYLNLLIPYQNLLKDICDALDIKDRDLVLEAGCGTGNLAIKIKERGANVVGLDYSKEALEIYKKKDFSAKIVLGDLSEKLPFPDNYFNKIACNNTLYTLPKERQLAILKEFLRILKPGGKIAVANPKKGWSAIKIYTYGIKQEIKKEGLFKASVKVLKFIVPAFKILYYNSKIKNKSGYTFLSLEEQKELLEKAGFVQVSDSKLVYASEGILNTGVK